MAAESGAVGDDVAITDDAVMGDMAIHHEQVLTAHPGDHTATDSPRIERRELPDGVVVADDQLAGFASIF